MTANMAKLVIAGVLAVTLIVAILIDAGNRDWAVPLLGGLVGYVIGNAQVTGNSPIVRKG